MMEANDIRENFGEKYDQSIVMAERQLLKLEAEGRVKIEATVKAELVERQKQLEVLEKAARDQSMEREAAAREELSRSLTTMALRIRLQPRVKLS
jgi:hypothetical protein